LKTATDRANAIGSLYDQIPASIAELRDARKAKDTKRMKEGMQALRQTIDALETMTDADLWPVPTYSELLFIPR
jgi:glutamine synthetase